MEYNIKRLELIRRKNKKMRSHLTHIESNYSLEFKKASDNILQIL